VFRGFAWGLLFGLPFGTAAGMSTTVEKLFGPLLNSIRQVPPLAWLPLIVLWFGIGEIGKMVIIAKAVFFPVFLNTLQGIRTVNREYVEVARVYEFTRYQLIRRVIFPGALPSIFIGVRFGAGLAWVTIVAAEMLSGRKGVGYILTRGQDLLQTDEVFVVIFVIGVIGFILDKVLKDTEGRLIKWKKSFVN
jgi:sulfonate transport system permease protein